MVAALLVIVDCQHFADRHPFGGEATSDVLPFREIRRNTAEDLTQFDQGSDGAFA
jgi:hypothetical protein